MGYGRKNRLAHEKSPYLLQHAENPVNWYPWGTEAFEKASRDQVPIFLSIGYATCHWCHVMAHESFEDEQVAGILNEGFVPVKVDREERPDIDKIYMDVCQALTGRGGWPLTVIMTPQGKPFFAGTYFPKTGRMGMPGLIDILNQVADLWRSDRGHIHNVSEDVTKAIRGMEEGGHEAEIDLEEILQRGFSRLSATFDPQWGGFGDSPKFPTPHNLTFLLRWHKRSKDPLALEMVEKTLVMMRNGGIFDQIGFGFHRYSVDERWLVPHFEKMLYDQALIAITCLETSRLTGRGLFGDIASDIFTYVLRDMTGPQGGFYSAEDADSEGKEGLFYVWRPEEIKREIGRDKGDVFCRFFGISDKGNFEDKMSIPFRRFSRKEFAEKEGISPEELKTVLEEARVKLFKLREKRPHPLKDDKILCSWNGLMIAALARGYAMLREKRYLDSAKKACAFIFERLMDSNGRLLHRYREGEAAHAGYLEDYAFLIWGLIELYESCFDPDYLEKAIALNRDMKELFWDDADGGFFFTGKGNEELITRSKDVHDGALPSENSVAALNLLRLARITGDGELEKTAEEIFRCFSALVNKHPAACTHLLSSVDFMLGPGMEIVIAGDREDDETGRMISFVRKRFLPNSVLILKSGGGNGDKLTSLCPFVKHMRPQKGRPSAYVCEHFSCRKPFTDPEALEKYLKSM